MIELHHGDCLEVMPTLEAGSIDLTVTSPPYDNLRTYNDSLEWGEHVWKPVMENLYRLTKEGGVVVWIVGDATIKGSETGTSFRQALYAMECGFRLHDTMIYQKPAVPYDPKCNRYWQEFEYMFVFSRGKPTCNYIMEPCKGAGKRKAGDYGQKRHDGTARTDRHDETRLIKSHKVKSNIWFYTAGRREKGHPAQFPESLARDHIISWSNPGDTVFDPFIGSGTTGKMAIEQGRKFIGIEKDAEYFEIAKKRIEGDGLFAK
jgi:site-specific DNA-methyltransferase (adenine-specific)